MTQNWWNTSKAASRGGRVINWGNPTLEMSQIRDLEIYNRWVVIFQSWIFICWCSWLQFSKWSLVWRVYHVYIILEIITLQALLSSAPQWMVGSIKGWRKPHTCLVGQPRWPQNCYAWQKGCFTIQRKERSSRPQASRSDIIKFYFCVQVRFTMTEDAMIPLCIVL